MHSPSSSSNGTALRLQIPEATLQRAARTRIPVWLIAGAVALIALLPRVVGTADFYTTDEAYYWEGRVARFAAALSQADWAATNQTGHPGVTTMWLGALGRWIALQVSAPLPGPGQSASYLSYLRLPVAVVNALLIASGVFAGLGLLTKAPALILPPLAGLILVGAALASARRKGAGVGKVRLALGIGMAAGTRWMLWIVATLLSFIMLWPAIWVDPGGAIGAVVEEIAGNAAQPHGSGNFFFGQPVDDPGGGFCAMADVPIDVGRGACVQDGQSPGMCQVKSSIDTAPETRYTANQSVG